MSALDRREFLVRAGALVAAPALGPILRGGRRRAAGPPFEWGVASFDPTADSVLLWTRVTPGAATAELEWAIARDEALTEVVASGRVAVDPATDHCAIV